MLIFGVKMCLFLGLIPRGKGVKNLVIICRYLKMFCYFKGYSSFILGIWRIAFLLRSEAVIFVECLNLTYVCGLSDFP
jgi:hypothetical protein